MVDKGQQWAGYRDVFTPSYVLHFRWWFFHALEVLSQQLLNTQLGANSTNASMPGSQSNVSCR